MSKDNFRWNPDADQPHNVFPRRERRLHHLRHIGSYFPLIASNLGRIVPGLSRYRRLRKNLYTEPVSPVDGIALSDSPAESGEEETIGLLLDTGVDKTLFRIPSWERGRLAGYERFLSHLEGRIPDIGLALLQNRADVLDPPRWKSFLEEVFFRFADKVSFFEIGHAWNRTKWGVWDYTEYLRLAEPAVGLAERCGVKIVGPAVIDFEFHLYPPVMARIPFDTISSLLYVDRVGAPENTQFGWDLGRKLALLKATVDVCGRGRKSLWITEFNWPLEGTGKYSPVAGKPNVSEEKQADYLVRYYILCLASGFVDRIYWWQLVAPGYGLVDSRETPWRRRPSYFALKTLVGMLRGAGFVGAEFDGRIGIFYFRKAGDSFAACWSLDDAGSVLKKFSRPVSRMVDRDGRELKNPGETVELESSPKYVFFER